MQITVERYHRASMRTYSLRVEGYTPYRSDANLAYREDRNQELKYMIGLNTPLKWLRDNRRSMFNCQTSHTMSNFEKWEVTIVDMALHAEFVLMWYPDEISSNG